MCFPNRSFWSYQPSKGIFVFICGLSQWTFRGQVNSLCGSSDSIIYFLPKRCRSRQKKNSFFVLTSSSKNLYGTWVFLLIDWYKVGFCHHSYRFVMFNSRRSVCIQKLFLQVCFWGTYTCVCFSHETKLSACIFKFHLATSYFLCV